MIIFAREIVRNCKPNGQGEITRAPSPLFYNGEENLNASKMSKRKTTKEFVEQAQKVHGERYDYSKTEYIDAFTNVCIICPVHGEFWQTPDNHLHKKGCPKCCGKNKTTEDFIAQAKKVHGDKYDYSKAIYKGSATKLCIICPEHGEFWQTPDSHLIGRGCNMCGHDTVGKKKRLTTDVFIRRAREVHGDKYDYSKVEYVTSDDKVCIICPEHGEFWQRSIDHLSGRGCPKCARLATIEAHKDNKQSFVEKAQAIHGDYYCYDLVDYVSSQVPVCIICPIHGEFWQAPNHHLMGGGCRRCYDDSLKVLIFGVGINDVCQSHKTKAYNRWRNMLYRCYCEEFLNEHPTYKGCSICEDWKYFSKFKEWFDAHNVSGWALDKDLLIENNKLYSPETCCFIPFEINAIFRCDVSESTKVKRSRELAEKYKCQLETRVYERLCHYGEEE